MAREETLERVEQRVELGRISARVAVTPEISVRLVAALLALAVATVHVADQGGIRVLNSPALLGWGFRLVEIGGVLTALVILARPARLAWLGWVAGVLLGAGPFIGYITTRTVGVPGDPQDVGNWGYWIGTLSLIVEAALVTLSAGMLLVQPRRPPASR
jgi:hypothetical protein